MFVRSTTSSTLGSPCPYGMRAGLFVQYHLSWFVCSDSEKLRLVSDSFEYPLNGGGGGGGWGRLRRIRKVSLVDWTHVEGHDVIRPPPTSHGTLVRAKGANAVKIDGISTPGTSKARKWPHSLTIVKGHARILQHSGVGWGRHPIAHVWELGTHLAFFHRFFKRIF